MGTNMPVMKCLFLSAGVYLLSDYIAVLVVNIIMESLQNKEKKIPRKKPVSVILLYRCLFREKPLM